MLSMVLLPDERLFKKSETISEITDAVRNLAAAMIEEMHAQRGIGLAGVQVGVHQRLFVAQVGDEPARVFINPTITNFSDQIVPYEEGCLSIPGVYANVDRPDAVRLEAIDQNGDPFDLEIDGLWARVIQHEYDHLNGVLFYQHLSPRQQTRFLKSYQRTREGMETTG